HFENSTGWPAEGHVTTARDMAILARAKIKDHPEHYSFYKEKQFVWNDIRQPNRNLLLFRDDSVDGIKTGHTDEAGFCLVASAKRGDMRLISVVMGTNSEEARAAESQKLLSYGFRYYDTRDLYAAGEVLNQARVWKGLSDQVNLGVQEAIKLTLPRGRHDDIQASLQIPETITAPLTAGQEMGQLRLMLDDELLAEVPVVALQAVEQSGFFARLWDGIKLFFRNLFS